MLYSIGLANSSLRNLCFANATFHAVLAVVQLRAATDKIQHRDHQKCVCAVSAMQPNFLLKIMIAIRKTCFHNNSQRNYDLRLPACHGLKDERAYLMCVCACKQPFFQ